jgi:hypothetical protein
MYNLKNKISMARSIVHMDMDTFFVSCERLTNSKLIGLPLIIVATEVWSLLVPMRLGHLVFVLQCLSNGATPLSASKSDERRYGIVF